MTLFCSLYGHWQQPLIHRTRKGTVTHRCWMCDDALTLLDGEWETDQAAIVDPAKRSRPQWAEPRVPTFGDRA